MSENYFNLRGDSFGGFELPAHIFEILPKDKNAAILDVGCGLCKHLSKLKELGYENLLGIDVAGEAVSEGGKYGIEVIKIDDIIKFSSECKKKFDFIIMAHVIEHIEKQKIIPTLKSIASLLNPNGSFYSVVPNAQSNTGCYWAYEDFTHHTLFTAGSILYVLKAAGFERIRFLDISSLSGLKNIKKIMRKILLRIYVLNFTFWNRVTDSHFHNPSPKIFSFEIKVLAQKV